MGHRTLQESERVTGHSENRSHMTRTIPEERPLTPSSDGSCYNTIPVPPTNVNKRRSKLVITTHYLFITTYLKMFSIERIIIISVITFCAFGLGIASLLPSILSSKAPPDSLQSIGDESSSSSALISLSSSIALVSIKLIESQRETATIYLTSSKPTEKAQYLPQVKTPKLPGSSRYNYNYYGADEPIYLLPNSHITYAMNIVINNSSKCPTRLYLFDNFSSYINFKNNKSRSIEAVAFSPCLPVNTHSSTNFTWMINVTGSYYVGIEIDNGVIVDSNVSVYHVYYNVNGLERPENCTMPLSAEHPFCQITLCNQFYCNRNNKYLVVNPTGNIEVSYSFSAPRIYGQTRMTFFIISLIIFIVSIGIPLLIVTKTFYKSCRRANFS